MVEPLRKTRNADSGRYERPREVEEAIEALARLPRAELVRQSLVADRKAEGFVPTECVLHFLRASRHDNGDRHFEALFKILIDRVRRALPRSEAGTSASGGAPISAVGTDTAEAVEFRFTELLVAERARGYEERLDFFEVRFDMALAALRQTASKRTRTLERRETALGSDDDADGVSNEVEAAALEQALRSRSKSDDPDIRLRLHRAIAGLRNTQRRVIELRLLGYPIHSSDPVARTISSILNLDQRTVRYHRDNAVQALRRILEGDD